MSFRFWKNFKRHGKEKHGGLKRFSCSICCYRSNRNHDLLRHFDSKHHSVKFISSLLDDLVSSLITSKEDTPDKSVEDEDDSEDTSDNNIVNLVTSVEDEDDGAACKISAYERARNERIAEMRAEFARRFPTFKKDVRDLRMVKTGLPRRKRGEVKASRQSNRIKDLVGESSVLVDELIGMAEPATQEDVGDTFVGEAGDNGMVEAEMEGGVETLTREDATGETRDSVIEDNRVCVTGEASHDVPGETSEIVTGGTIDDETGVNREDATGEDVTGETGEDVTGVNQVLGKFGCLPCGLAFR